MSVALVILPEEGPVVVATDTRGQLDSTWVETGPKWIERHGFILAFVGLGLVGRALRHGDPFDTDDPASYVDAALLWLKERGALDADGSVEAVFLVVGSDRAWVFDGRGSLAATLVRGEFYAIGSGAHVATGALHALREVREALDPVVAASIAVGAATRWNTGCGGPASIVKHVADEWRVV